MSISYGTEWAILPVRSTVFTPWTTKSRNDEAVGWRICDFFTRIEHCIGKCIVEVEIENLDKRRRIRIRLRNASRHRLVVGEESAVMRIACHRAKDHAQVAGTTRATGHQIQRRTKTNLQVIDLCRVAAIPMFFSGTLIIFIRDQLINIAAS